MTSRRNAPLSSLTLVLPHPPLPRRGPASATTPQTPRSSSSMSTPSLFKMESAGPRKSTDSWNSSNYEGGDDEMDWEWTAEQVSLLGKASRLILFYHHFPKKIYPRHSMRSRLIFLLHSTGLFPLPTFSTKLHVALLTQRTLSNGHIPSALLA